MPSTIKQIYDKFNRHPVTDSYADYSRIGRIGIASNKNAYRIVAHPGRTILGLNIDITVPGGIFSKGAPTRVETSPNFGSLVGMKVDESSQGANIGTKRGELAQPPATEVLLLPGDEGFELFTQLHTQVSALEPIVGDTIATAGIVLDPTLLGVSDENSGTQMLDPLTGGTIHCRDLRYQVGNASGNTFRATLDGSVITPGGVQIGRKEHPNGSLPVFRSGTYRVDAQPDRPLNFDSLIAFSGLQCAIQELYL